MNRRRPQSLGGTQVLPRLAKYTLLPINQSRLARQSGSISQDSNGVLTILTVPTSDRHRRMLTSSAGFVLVIP
jgi:hypothetical protein